MTTLFRESDSLNQGIIEDLSASKVKQGFQKQTIAITATFTAEPVGESLAYWFRELALDSSITFAPYNQLFQQLLDPNSLLSQNQQGFKLILLRLENWQRVRFGSSARKTRATEETLVYGKILCYRLSCYRVEGKKRPQNV